MTPVATGGCFDAAELQEIVERGFADAREKIRFLAHFGFACKVCLRSFLLWAETADPPDLSGDPQALSKALADPPRRALLRYRADVRGAFGPGIREIGTPLHFLWSMAAEARNLSLALPGPEAVACVRDCLEDLELLRRTWKSLEMPPALRGQEQATPERMALHGWANEAVAAELQRHHQAPEEVELFRRRAEQNRHMSEMTRWLEGAITDPEKVH